MYHLKQALFEILVTSGRDAGELQALLMIKSVLF